jgi:hypothetical protein
MSEKLGFRSTSTWLIAREDLDAIIRRGSSNLLLVLCLIKRQGIKTYGGVEVAPCIHNPGIRWRRVSISRACHFSLCERVPYIHSVQYLTAHQVMHKSCSHYLYFVTLHIYILQRISSTRCQATAL